MLFVLLTIAGVAIIAVVALPIYYVWITVDNIRARLANARAIKASARGLHRAATGRDEKA